MNNIDPHLNWADFDIDPRRGFLPPSDPLECLPRAYAPWERSATSLPPLLAARRARPALERLPELPTNGLESHAELERALLLLTHLASAYVWESDPPATIIPRGLARPLWAVAERLERPPVLTYASSVLHNWRRLRPEEAPGADSFLEQIAIQHTFCGGIDEQWFYLIPTAIEEAGGEFLRELATAKIAVAMNMTDRLGLALERIHRAIGRIYSLLLRIPERCDPYIFFHRVRPFLRGWPAPGVIFEGVSDTPVTLLGSSAAQSPLIRAIDIALGISHAESESAYFREMQSYMKAGHRRFLAWLANGPSVSDYAAAQRTDADRLCELYNNCVKALESFRGQHLAIAVQYVVRQDTNRGAGVSVGTGGTPLVQFLTGIHASTRGHLIETDERPAEDVAATVREGA